MMMIRLCAFLVLTHVTSAADAAADDQVNSGGYSDATAHDPYYGQPPTLTLDIVNQLLESLETGADMLLKDLGEAGSQNAAAEDRIQPIRDNLLPGIRQQMSQQEGQLNTLGDQLKDLQHRMKRGLAAASEAQSLANSMASTLDQQINDHLSGPGLAGVNDAQQMQIDEIKDCLDDEKTDLKGQLDAAREALDVQMLEIQEEVDTLQKGVHAPKCEQATCPLQMGQNTVFFHGSFTEVPTVSLTLTGFTAHLDQQSYEEHDHLGLDQYVSARTTTSFNVTLVNLSQGSAALTTVYGTWLACQV